MRITYTPGSGGNVLDRSLAVITDQLRARVEALAAKFPLYPLLED